MSELEQVLSSCGPCLSSLAAAELSRRFGLSPAAARQRIARSKFPVRVLELQFQRRASFLYLTDQFQTPQFLSALSDALEENGGAYARTLQALIARGGIMPLAHLSAAAALSEAPRQLSAGEVTGRLEQVGVLESVAILGHGVCTVLKAGPNDVNFAKMRARLIAENIVLEATKEWARKLGIGSYDAFRLRGAGEVPKVSRFEWDLSAPSYISGLTTWRGEAVLPGFLVADVLLNEQVDERAIRPFLYKCHTLRALKGPRCLQLFLADHFSREAFGQLRQIGVVPATIEELFGKEVAEALRLLVSTLTQTAAAVVDPIAFEKMFSGLGKFEGAAGQLRGALFEFVAAALLQEEGWHEVVINKKYRENGRDLAEVDVRARQADRMIFVECKGILPGSALPDDEVEAWLDRRIPAIVRRTRQNEEHAHCKLEFELWVTGVLSDEAEAWIDERKRSVRATNYSLKVRRADELKSMAYRHRSRQPALFEVLRKHFLTNPLKELNAVDPARLAPSISEAEPSASQ